MAEFIPPLPQPLPVATKVASQLTAELFGDAVMLLEFLQTFGPLFNIREAIREGITFGKHHVCGHVVHLASVLCWHKSSLATNMDEQ